MYRTVRLYCLCPRYLSLHSPVEPIPCNWELLPRMVLVAEGEEKDERGWKWWWFVFFASFSFHAQCFNATFTLSEVGSSTANSGVSLVFHSLPTRRSFCAFTRMSCLFTSRMLLLSFMLQLSVTWMPPMNTWVYCFPLWWSYRSHSQWNAYIYHRSIAIYTVVIILLWSSFWV